MDLLNFKWKPFLISFVAIFLMVALPKLGIKVDSLHLPQFFYTVLNNETYTKILNPQPNPNEEFDNIKPRLEQKPNEYKIKKTTSLIKDAGAIGEVEEAAGYGIIDFDSGEVIEEKNLSKKLPIASLTKIMTAVVALDLARPDEMFTVSEKASKIIPTKIGVVPGQKISLKELLEAALMTSANDAVQVIKEGVDQKYGQPVFIRSMNAKAEYLGLRETHFTNPQGFDNSNHFSSIEDLAVLSHYALAEYPLIREIAKKDYIKLEEDDYHKQFDLYNWNGLIGVYPGIEGLKIGNTGEALHTTVVLAVREGKKIIVVLLGAPGVLERDLWAAQLLDLGFEKTLGLEPVNVTTEQLREKYSTWEYF